MLNFLRILYDALTVFMVILAVYTGLNGMLAVSALWTVAASCWAIGSRFMSRALRNTRK